MTTEEKKDAINNEKLKICFYQKEKYRIRSSHSFEATTNTVLTDIEIKNLNLLLPNHLEVLIKQLEVIKDAALKLQQASVEQHGLFEALLHLDANGQIQSEKIQDPWK